MSLWMRRSGDVSGQIPDAELTAGRTTRNAGGCSERRLATQLCMRNMLDAMQLPVS